MPLFSPALAQGNITNYGANSAGSDNTGSNNDSSDNVDFGNLNDGSNDGDSGSSDSTGGSSGSSSGSTNSTGSTSGPSDSTGSFSNSTGSTNSSGNIDGSLSNRTGSTGSTNSSGNIDGSLSNRTGSTSGLRNRRTNSTNGMNPDMEASLKAVLPNEDFVTGSIVGSMSRFSSSNSTSATPGLVGMTTGSSKVGKVSNQHASVRFSAAYALGRARGEAKAVATHGAASAFAWEFKQPYQTEFYHNCGCNKCPCPANKGQHWNCGCATCPCPLNDTNDISGPVVEVIVPEEVHSAGAADAADVADDGKTPPASVATAQQLRDVRQAKESVEVVHHNYEPTAAGQAEMLYHETASPPRIRYQSPGTAHIVFPGPAEALVHTPTKPRSTHIVFPESGRNTMSVDQHTALRRALI